MGAATSARAWSHSRARLVIPTERFLLLFSLVALLLSSFQRVVSRKRRRRRRRGEGEDVRAESTVDTAGLGRDGGGENKGDEGGELHFGNGLGG